VSEERSRGGAGRHLRQTLLTGLVVVLPLFITVWLLTALFRLVDGAITPWVRRALLLTGMPLFQEPALFHQTAPVIGLLITVLLIYTAGLLSTNLLGVKLLTAFDSLMLRIPVVRGVYGGSKQLLEAFSPQAKKGFTRVVLVEYPRKGVYTVGFVTREFGPDMAVPVPEPMASVFLPTTPNPTSGWVAVLPARELIPLPVSVEEGVKLVVSGGIVVPERWEASPIGATSLPTSPAGR
jgi:uncharacterized membrane protein